MPGRLTNIGAAIGYTWGLLYCTLGAGPTAATIASRSICFMLGSVIERTFILIPGCAGPGNGKIAALPRQGRHGSMFFSNTSFRRSEAVSLTGYVFGSMNTSLKSVRITPE